MRQAHPNECLKAAGRGQNVTVDPLRQERFNHSHQTIEPPAPPAPRGSGDDMPIAAREDVGGVVSLNRYYTGSEALYAAIIKPSVVT